jgi:hypothetical protein
MRKLCKQNAKRADWALRALVVFAAEPGPSLESEADTAIAHFIGDLGHECERRGFDFLRIVARGVGMWSAESRVKDGDPYLDDIAHVHVEYVDQHGAILVKAETRDKARS